MPKLAPVTIVTADAGTAAMFTTWPSSTLTDALRAKTCIVVFSLPIAIDERSIVS